MSKFILSSNQADGLTRLMNHGCPNVKLAIDKAAQGDREETIMMLYEAFGRIYKPFCSESRLNYVSLYVSSANRASTSSDRVISRVNKLKGLYDLRDGTWSPNDGYTSSVLSKEVEFFCEISGYESEFYFPTFAKMVGCKPVLVVIPVKDFDYLNGIYTSRGPTNIPVESSLLITSGSFESYNLDHYIHCQMALKMGLDDDMRLYQKAKTYVVKQGNLLIVYSIVQVWPNLEQNGWSEEVDVKNQIVIKRGFERLFNAGIKRMDAFSICMLKTFVNIMHKEGSLPYSSFEVTDILLGLLSSRVLQIKEFEKVGFSMTNMPLVVDEEIINKVFTDKGKISNYFCGKVEANEMTREAMDKCIEKVHQFRKHWSFNDFIAKSMQVISDERGIGVKASALSDCFGSGMRDIYCKRFCFVRRVIWISGNSFNEWNEELVKSCCEIDGINPHHHNGYSFFSAIDARAQDNVDSIEEGCVGTQLKGMIRKNEMVKSTTVLDDGYSNEPIESTTEVSFLFDCDEVKYRIKKLYNEWNASQTELKAKKKELMMKATEVVKLLQYRGTDEENIKKKNRFSEFLAMNKVDPEGENVEAIFKMSYSYLLDVESIFLLDYKKQMYNTRTLAGVLLEAKKSFCKVMFPEMNPKKYITKFLELHFKKFVEKYHVADPIVFLEIEKQARLKKFRDELASDESDDEIDSQAWTTRSNINYSEQLPLGFDLPESNPVIGGIPIFAVISVPARSLGIIDEIPELEPSEEREYDNGKEDEPVD